MKFGSYFKIGYTTRDFVFERICEIVKGSNLPDRIDDVYVSQLIYEPSKAEKAIHYYLRQKVRSREWFEISSEELIRSGKDINLNFEILHPEIGQFPGYSGISCTANLSDSDLVRYFTSPSFLIPVKQGDNS